MAGLQTDGFRINQTPSVVSALDPAKHSIDPSLLIRGLKDGMKFGSDIMAELDELSLRPDKLKAAKTKLQADTAVDTGRLRVAPGAADSDIAINAARARVAPFKADADIALADSVVATTPSTRDSVIAQSKLDAARNTAVLPFVPQQAALTQMGLNADKAKAEFAALNLPIEQSNAGLRLSADSIKAQEEYDYANGASPKVTDLPGTDMMAVSVGGKQTLVPKAKPPEDKSEFKEETLLTKEGIAQRWRFKFDAQGNQTGAVLLGETTGSNSAQVRATAKSVADLKGSLELLDAAHKEATAYNKAGKGGIAQSVMAAGTQVQAGMNPWNNLVRGASSALIDPDTFRLNSTLLNATNQIRNALFGAALTEGEMKAAIGMLPVTDDLAKPSQMISKINTARNFIATKLAAFAQDHPGAASADMVTPGRVAPASKTDLNGVPVTAAAPAQSSGTSLPVDTEIYKDDQGNHYAKINGEYVLLQFK